MAVDDTEWLEDLNRHFRIPDVTFLFQLEPSECIKRIQGRGSEFELFEKEEKLIKIREGYEQVKNKYDNIYLIDASKSIEEIAEEVWEVVARKLKH